MQSPIHPSPMQSPMRHGSQMIPGAPDGNSNFKKQNPLKLLNFRTKLLPFLSVCLNFSSSLEAKVLFKK